jgi:hypothetical protein
MLITHLHAKALGLEVPATLLALADDVMSSSLLARDLVLVAGALLATVSL